MATKAQLEATISALEVERRKHNKRIARQATFIIKMQEELDRLHKAPSQLPASPLDATLAERGKLYGEFAGHAEITQELKAVMHSSYTSNWNSLSFAHKEALEMIVHKIGRILNGDPNYDDSWIDIGGYAKLGEKECQDEKVS
jgi:hypothetical protein